MDYAEKDRQEFIKTGERTPDSNNIKRELAIKTLGDAWILHPQYKHNPRHTNNGSWIMHSVLRGVADQARAEGRINVHSQD